MANLKTACVASPLFSLSSKKIWQLHRSLAGRQIAQYTGWHNIAHSRNSALLTLIDCRLRNILSDKDGSFAVIWLGTTFQDSPVWMACKTKREIMSFLWFEAYRPGRSHMKVFIVLVWSRPFHHPMLSCAIFGVIVGSSMHDLKHTNMCPMSKGPCSQWRRLLRLI